MGVHRVHQYSEEYRQRTSEGDVGVEISYLDSVKKPKLLRRQAFVENKNIFTHFSSGRMAEIIFPLR